MVPASDVNDEPFPADAVASLDEVPGAEVTWSRRTVAALEALSDRADAIATARPDLVGPNGLRAYRVAPHMLKQIAALTSLDEHAERVARYVSDLGHADEHDEPMTLTPEEYGTLQLDEIRARTSRPGDRTPWDARIARWRSDLDGLAAFARAAQPGDHGCIVVGDEPA